LTGDRFTIDPDLFRVSRLRRRVHSWSDTLREFLYGKSESHRLVMVTLTYADRHGWRKNHIRDYLVHMRKILNKNLLGYAWVAELQERGAVHYHVLFLVCNGANVPMPDKSGLWSHGLSRVETARSVFYIVKYTQKALHTDKNFPRGLRLFAVWVSKEIVSADDRWAFRLSSLPTWLKFEVIDLYLSDGLKIFPTRRKGGGWFLGFDELHSPYGLVSLFD